MIFRQKPQRVPAELVQRARDHGEAAAARGCYLNAYTMNGTDRDPVILGRGKLGEVAAALFFRLSPDDAVNWTLGQPDDGADLCLPNGVRVDVKASWPPFKLIWPRSKNDKYLEKRFDVLLSVSVEQDDWQRCWIDGHVSKRAFYERKQIANGINCRLQIDTWFMDKDELEDSSDLQFDSLLHLYGAQAWDRLYGSLSA